ncbi:MAG: hypothetical protein WB699_16850 [Bacteroidota bacterium]
MITDSDSEPPFDRITIPDVPPLKHQEAASRRLFSQRRSSALMIWVVALPLYVVACAAMKTLFHRNLPLLSSFDEIQRSLGPAMTLLLFLILPLGGILAILKSSLHMNRDLYAHKRFFQIRMTLLNGVLSVVALSIILLYLTSALL